MDRTNRNTALASAMVEELARCGVRHAVIAPGSRSTPLALALWRQKGLEAHVIVDERSGGFFALGAAQATRTPVAIVCTSGTAAANLHPAVCEADESAVPLIVLTADRPPELRGIGAGQTIDQLKLYGDAVRWFCELGNHDADDAGLMHFRSVACRAFWTAAGDPRPGPIHLNVPWRDPLGPESQPADVTASSNLALEGRNDRPLTTVPPAPSPPAPQLVEALAERVAASRRGLIVAGRMSPGASREIADLAAATGFPILAEPTSQLRYGPHDGSAVVSAYEPIARERPGELAPDLILRFGDLPTCKPLRQWLAALDDAHQVAVDPAHGWNDPGRIAGAIVRAQPGTLAASLADRVERPGAESGWRERWLRVADAAAVAIATELDSLERPTEPGLQRALGSAYADGELIYTASSMPIRDQEAFLPGGDADVHFLANRGANGIDGLISSGIGAAAGTGRPTVIITGDLGFLHDLGSLAAIGEAPGSVRIVVINNEGGGIFSFLPQAGEIGEAEFEALLGTPRSVDAAAVASIFGIGHRRLAHLDQLPDALASGAGLIEVVTDRSANVELHRSLASVAQAAVDRALAKPPP